MNSDFPLAEYTALTTGVGIVDFSDRTQIELTGDDRATFLHNFCTNSIRDLQAGSGCEAFITDVRGHTLALVYVFAGEKSLVLETVADQGEAIIGHLDRYLIRERVELHDRGGAWSELLLAGAASEAWLQQQGVAPPQTLMEHCAAELLGRTVWIRRVDITLPFGFLVAFERSDLLARVLEAGVTVCGPMAFHTARIEAGTPFFGQDIDSDNLPQEVNRDARAIHFNKGCYLGQETVARIDALGHVNRTLEAVQFLGDDMPAIGCELFAGEKPVGKVTSATYSPRLSTPLALAYLRRGHNSPGTHLTSAAGDVQVIALPLKA